VINIGKVNTLTVERETNSGFYLRDEESRYEVFIPPSLAEQDLMVGDEVQAFIYPDATGALIATQKLPVAQVGEYALLQAVNVKDFGAFFEWGMDKDLLVPGNEQKDKVQERESHVVRICIEEVTDRIYGSTKLGKFIDASEFDIDTGDKVTITPVEITEIGYRSIINKKFLGMIYNNEIFEPIRVGNTYEGVVKKIREDNLVDAALQVQGFNNILSAKDTVYKYLQDNGGESPLNDKSSPELIYKHLKMSKKTFKSSIGILYKERKIVISPTGIKIA